LRVILRVADLSSEVRELEFKEPAAVLNGVLAAARHRAEQRFEEDVAVCARVYRHGTDVYFDGEVRGAVVCECPRCLDEFRWPFEREFRFLIAKAGPGQEFEDDAGLDHYEGDDVDVGRLAREQAVLALDDAALCSEGCRGLCARCGANLNRETCTCGEPR
jgi:uncharacterized protein